MSFHSVLIGCEVFQVYNEDKRKSGVTQSGPNRPAAHRQWGSKVPIKTVLKITLCHALNARSPCVFFCFVFFVNPFNSLLYGWRRWKKKMNEISFSLPKSTISSFIRIIYVVLNAFNDDRDWPLLLHLLLVSVKGFQAAWRPSFKFRFSSDYCRYRR